MKRYLISAIIVFILIFGALAYFSLKNKTEIKDLNYNSLNDNMKVKSVFNNNERIPEKYTCDSDNVNPPLEIISSNNAKSFVLIVDDPDAPSGTWVHWVVFNIKTKNIYENSVPGIQGKNDFGKSDYGGPCPPSVTHRYFFKVYALDNELNLKEGSNKSDVEKAMKGHIIDKTELIGKYSKN